MIFNLPTSGELITQIENYSIPIWDEFRPVILGVAGILIMAALTVLFWDSIISLGEKLLESIGSKKDKYDKIEIKK